MPNQRQSTREKNGRYAQMATCPRCNKRRELFPENDPNSPVSFKYAELCSKCSIEAHAQMDPQV